MRSHLPIAAALALLGWGCTPSATIPFTPVQPVELAYEPAPHAEPVTLAVVDARPAAERHVHVGTFVIDVEGMPDEMEYLASNLERVLRDYGADVRVENAATADLVLHVSRFSIRNYQSLVGQFHTFTTFRGELVTRDGARPIAAYSKGTRNADDDYEIVIRPCYQVPVEAVVQEVAAKINRLGLGRRVADTDIGRLADEVPAKMASIADQGIWNVVENRYSVSEEFFTILRLGYTNNAAAVPPLVALTNRKEVLMRAAAISALGTLGATDQLDLLRTIYRRDGDLGRLMALKSIGDLGTGEARAFLDEVRGSRAYAEPTIREVVDLYD